MTAKAAARLGDSCSGHADYPPRPNNEGSDNVFINGIPAHRQGDSYEIHCDPDNDCHADVLANGSGTVYFNGKQAGRIGDPVACGSVIAEGSDNTFIGD